MKKKKFSKFNIFKSKKGLTYVELLTALALLSLIVVTFTPMLLQSYETIYDAGERSAAVYESKETVEQGLARRDSEFSTKLSINLNLGLSSEKLFENIHVQGKKVISSIQQNFETLFGRGRASLEIVSGGTVNDDATSHEIVIQTKGLEFNSVKTGGWIRLDDNGDTDVVGEKEIYIQIIMPNKNAGDTGSTGIDVYNTSTVTTEDSAYGQGTPCTVNILEYLDGSVIGTSANISNTTSDGRIRLHLESSNPNKPLDFTYSPLQIKVYYRNTRGRLITVQEYLYIDPPSIIFAGDAVAGADYFTSAGVQHTQSSSDDNDINNVDHSYSLNIEPRKMRTDNSAYLSQTDDHTEAETAVGAPSSRGVTIRSIKWIDNDETQGLKPYYIMVGSEGAIYRMYNYSSASTAIYKQSVGIENINLDGTRNISNKTSFFGSVGASRVSNGGDKTYTISTGQRVYPSLWSGDYSDIFEYSSGTKRTAYGKSVNNKGKGDETWLTSLRDSSGIYAGKEINPDYHTFVPIAQYAYYYCGFNQVYEWSNKNYRTISYILTERGHAIRSMGTISDEDSYVDLFTMWDTSTHEYAAVLNKNSDIMGPYPNQLTRYDYWTSGNKGGSEDSVKYRRHNSPADVMSFRYENGRSNSDVFELQNTLAQIRLRALASYPMYSGIGMANYYQGDEKEWEVKDNQAKLPPVSRGYDGNGDDHLNSAGDDIELNDVVYIPTAGNTKGSTFYVGTMHAYADLTQTNKINANHVHNNNNDDTHDDVFQGYGYSIRQNGTRNNTCYPVGAISTYFVISDQDGRNTYVVRHDDSNTYGYWGEASDRYEGSGAGTDVGNPMIYFCYVLGMGKGTSGAPYKFPGSTSPATSATDDKTQFFIPDPGNQKWRYIHYDDVYFTLGFSSDRSRVYTNITYDGDTETEYTRSYERYYWRSHYGQDGYANQGDNQTLPLHTPNRALCYVNYDNTRGREFYNAGRLVNKGENLTYSNASGVTVSGLGTYTNHYNNDYYNVWFPGEMYNLTKIASKDGITVAVGYTVAGSSYQYSHKDQAPKTNGDPKESGDPYMLTSTALGGIYNDGVLSAMIQGKNDNFVNLLYYKDNESFDGTSLTNKNLAQYNAYKSQGNSHDGYGLHTRKSVQFTAVDIMVASPEVTEAGKTVPIKYYAVYGDNLGRAYYSLVASGSGTSSTTDGGDMGITADTSTLVPFIKDTTYAGAANNAAGEMKEITIGTEALDTIFKNIGTVDVSGNLIIITGEAKEGQNEYFVVGEITSVDSKTGEPNITWKKVQNGNFTAAITDATIVGEYYYFIGNDMNKGLKTDSGFLGAVSLEGLRDAAPNQVLGEVLGGFDTTGNAVTSDAKFKVIWGWVPKATKLYAIAGRETV